MLSSHHAYLNQFCSFQPHCLLGKYRETQRNKTITSASELCVSACPRHSALCAVASVTPVLAFCHFLAGDLCSSQMGRLAPCKAQLPVLALQETPGPPPAPNLPVPLPADDPNFIFCVPLLTLKPICLLLSQCASVWFNNTNILTPTPDCKPSKCKDVYFLLSSLTQCVIHC